MRIEPASAPFHDAWLQMRIALWPDEDARQLASEMAVRAVARGAASWLAFADKQPIGFAEVDLRHDHVNGCDTSPVAFLEGIYVAPEWRGRGVGRALSERCAQWGRDRGAAEYASDALIDNLASHAFHHAIGFEETERVVYFRRRLRS